MTDSNLVRLAYAKETSWGEDVVSPSLRNIRYTGETISNNITTTKSTEIVTDRLTTDLPQTGDSASGPIQILLSFGEYDDFFEAALMGTWNTTPYKDNNGTEDSNITNVTASTYTFTVASGGTAFVANHLIYNSGFDDAANNGLFKVGSSTTSTIVAANTPTLVDDSTPAANARIKVVGFEGASGDIAATSSGLSSTSLDFTTLGLSVGQWCKIGGSATANKFTGNPENNDWVRIAAITSHLLTLDNLPENWATDSGSSKTIQVFFGDVLKSGSERQSFVIEKGFLGLDIPVYIPFKGMMVNTFSLSFQPGEIVSGSFTFMGKNAGDAVETPLDSSVTDSESGEIMNAFRDVGRISEGGSVIAGPSYIQGFSISATNNLREQKGVGVYGLAGVGIGDFEVTGDISVYFEEVSMYNKIVNNTATSFSVIIGKSNQAYIFQLPRVKLGAGTPQATSRNTDVVISSNFTALKDPTTSQALCIDRFEYYAE